MIARVVLVFVLVLALGPFLLRARYARSHPLSARARASALRVAVGVGGVLLGVDALVLWASPHRSPGGVAWMVMSSAVVPFYLYWRLGGRLPNRRGR